MSGLLRRQLPPEEQERAAKETIAKLDRFFAIKGGGDAKCPICQTSQWHLSQDADFEANLILLTNEDHLLTHPIAHMPVYVLTCANCSFVRMHAKNAVDYAVDGKLKE